MADDVATLANERGDAVTLAHHARPTTRISLDNGSHRGFPLALGHQRPVLLENRQVVVVFGRKISALTSSSVLRRPTHTQLGKPLSHWLNLVEKLRGVVLKSGVSLHVSLQIDHGLGEND